MGILYILLGAAFGAIITYLRLQNNETTTDKDALEKLKQRDQSLVARLKSGEEKHQRFEEELKSMKSVFDQRESELHKLNAELATIKSKFEEAAKRNIRNDQTSATPTPTVNRDLVVDQPSPSDIVVDRSEVEMLQEQVKALVRKRSELEAVKRKLEEERPQLIKKIEVLERDLQELTSERDGLNLTLSKEKEEHQTTKKELDDQKTALRSLGKKYPSDFERIGVKILNELEKKTKR